MSRRSLRQLGTLVAVAVVVTGCQVGQRPTLAPAPAPTGDTSADVVIELLQAGGTVVFEAEYSIAGAAGQEASASVAQDGAGTRTVTIGTTQYFVDGASSQTCDTRAGECETGINPQPLSALGVSPDFFSTSAAARLRRDAAIRVGPTTETDETIAGQPATCVAVPIQETASMFCALDGGLLARWRTTDLTIELVSVTRDA